MSETTYYEKQQFSVYITMLYIIIKRKLITGIFHATKEGETLSLFLDVVTS
jgi:hypothetical protein